jgi:hypothetical protein
MIHTESVDPNLACIFRPLEFDVGPLCGKPGWAEAAPFAGKAALAINGAAPKPRAES